MRHAIAAVGAGALVVLVSAFGERSPRVALPVVPLIRVVEGTVVVAHLANALADSTVTWYGLTTKPGMDSIRLRPGESTMNYVLLLCSTRVAR